MVVSALNIFLYIFNCRCQFSISTKNRICGRFG